MTKKTEFLASLYLTKRALGISGIHLFPKQHENFIKSFIKSWLFYFNLLWCYPDIIGEAYYAIDEYRSGTAFTDLVMAVPLATISVMSTVKSYPLFANRELVRNILERLRSMHPNTEVLEGDERGIVKEAMELLNLVVKCLYYSCGVVMVFFLSLPVMYMIYGYYSSGIFVRQLPYFVKYFFDPYTAVTWPFVYIHQSWASFIVCVNVFGTDTLLYVFVTYIQMHFRILCYSFEKAVSDDVMVTIENFRRAVKKHQELIDLVEKTEELYSKSTLFNFMSSSFLICLSGFVVTFVDDVGMVLSFVAFLVMSLSQIFLFCFLGEMLTTSSTQVYEAVYGCKWYDADQTLKRCVLLVMIRAQSPCKLTAMGFADLNLSAFTTILSRSWSYFALLKTLYE